VYWFEDFFGMLFSRPNNQFWLPHYRLITWKMVSTVAEAKDQNGNQIGISYSHTTAHHTCYWLNRNHNNEVCKYNIMMLLWQNVSKPVFSRTQPSVGCASTQRQRL
jgi:hypothetical protein